MKKICGLGLVVILGVPALLHAQESKVGEPKASDLKFMRLKEEDGKVSALEIAITRYTNKSKALSVDLVGVVHIGDKAYYQKLNKRLGEYDVVLYELVAPPGTKVPKGGKKEGASGFMSMLMTTMLDLDSQVACIDYHQKHFVHADLSFETMMEAAKERGEDKLTLGLSILTDFLRQQNLAARKKKDASPGEEFDLAGALANPNLLKRDMAKQMMSGADFGRTLETLLIGDRNKKACQVLTQEIADGKKKLAIFYGAAHMPDFDKRMREEFGLERQGQEWFTAWEMRDGKGDPNQRFKSLLEKAIQP